MTLAVIWIANVSSFGYTPANGTCHALAKELKSLEAEHQGQIISVGILNFRDESGAGTSTALGQKIAQLLQQKINATHKDLLARPLAIEMDSSSTKATTIEQLAAFGKQNGMKFVIRGGVLSVATENSGGDLHTAVQIYADIVSVETLSISTVRAEGAGAQRGAGSETPAQLIPIDFMSDKFQTSSLGQAVSSAIERLAASVADTVASSSPQAPKSGTVTSAEQQENATGASQGGKQTGAAQSQDAAAVEADEALQQLIAQAEGLVSSGAGGSSENLKKLGQALEAVRAGLATKASLLEQARDTAQADQEIALRKENLQTALTQLTEEVAANTASGSPPEQPSGEKKGFMTRIDEFAGQASSLLQKIQEMRAALRGASEEQAADTTGGAGETSTEGAMPSQESTADVDGVVTQDGNPVEGAAVTDQESGISTTTDSNGSYSLKGLLSGRLAKLILSKGQKKMNAQVQVVPGRANLADFQFKPMSAGPGMASLTILPSTVVISTTTRLGGLPGQVKGAVQDAQGHPVARALVTLKGLGVARTSSLGQYAFLNVPAGLYQLTVNHSALKMKSTQVQVGQRKIAEANFKFSQGDAIAKLSTTTKSLILPGAATVLRGMVFDNQNHPVAGAKVSAVQSESVISVFTGSNGTFELRNIKPGPYRITVYKVGYHSVGQTLALRSGGIEERKFQLEKESSPLIAGLLKNQAARRGEIRIPAKRDDQNLSKDVVTVQVALKGQLMGRVTDASNGKPLSGVSISTRGQVLADTDSKGNYTVSGLAPGAYAVSVKRSGYLLDSRTITVLSSPPTRQDFALKAERRSEDQSISSGIRKSVTIGGGGVRTGQVTGQVIDVGSGKPIPGATVSLAGQRGIVSDQSGRFAISNLAPGTYQVTVSKGGFATDQRAVAARAGETAQANFKLKPLTRPPVRLRLQ